MEVVVDVDKIVAIKITDKQEYKGYKWFPQLPPKKIFFGLIESHPGFREGFYEYGLRRCFTTVESLIIEGFLVDEDEKKIYSKPRIEIRLSNGDYVSKKFNTLLEANEYVSKLELASKNKFERIKT